MFVYFSLNFLFGLSVFFFFIFVRSAIPKIACVSSNSLSSFVYFDGDCYYQPVTLLIDFESWSALLDSLNACNSRHSVLCHNRPVLFCNKKKKKKKRSHSFVDEKTNKKKQRKKSKTNEHCDTFFMSSQAILYVYSFYCCLQPE